MKPLSAGLLTVVFALSGSAAAQKTTSTCPATLNVTVTVHDYDATGTLLLVRSDDYNGSGQAQYSVTSDPYITTNVTCGKFRFNLYSQTKTTQAFRTLYITPNDAINGSQPPGPAPGYFWQNVELASGCYDQNGNVVYLQNVLTSSGNCGMILDFNSGGTKYKLSIGPGCSGCVGVPAPTTGLVSVTCNAVQNSQCVSWTFAPNMTPSSTNPPSVANLYYYSKGSQPLTFVGQYYMTFNIGATP